MFIRKGALLLISLIFILTFVTADNLISPLSSQQFNQTDTILISLNVTRNRTIDDYIANITLPNQTTTSLYLQRINNRLYQNNFTQTNLLGNYSINIIITTRTYNLTTIGPLSFSVVDIIPPTLSLGNPTNETNTTNSTIFFNFTASDANPFTCTLLLDSQETSLNSTTYQAENISIGYHEWNITCSDSSHNNITSETRVLTVYQNTSHEIIPETNLTEEENPAPVIRRGGSSRRITPEPPPIQETTFIVEPLANNEEPTIEINEQSQTLLNEAKKNVDLLLHKNIPTTRIQHLLLAAANAFYSNEPEEVAHYTEELTLLTTQAVKAQEELNLVEQNMKKAKKQWLTIEETEQLFTEAQTAFSQEEFQLALEKTQDASFTLLTETKGKINPLWILSNYGIFILLLLISLGSAGYVLLNTLPVLNKRIEHLHVKEQTLKEQINESKQREAHKSYKKFKQQLQEIQSKREHLIDKREPHIIQQ